MVDEWPGVAHLGDMATTPPSPDQYPHPRGPRPTTRPPTLAEQLASVALEAFLGQLPPDVRAAVEVALPDEGKASPWARLEPAFLRSETAARS